MITGATRVAAVVGWPIEHSRSPAMLNAAFAAAAIDAVMIPIGVPPEGFAEVVAGLRAQRALGASVTLPHKLAAAALCEELSPAAHAVGAVNCLGFDGGRVVGHNTDEAGFVDALLGAGFDPLGKRCVVLGAGGAARAIAYALRGAREIQIFARREVAWWKTRPWQPAELRDGFARADLVVDCTSAGLAGDDAAFCDGLPLDALAPAAWVATLVYHRTTGLLERAAARGHSTLDGRGMLVHQAARAFTIWTGAAAPISTMTQALDAALVKNA